MTTKGMAFISGAYSGRSPSEVEDNLSRATQVVKEALKAGWVPVCPNVFWHPFADLQEYDFWLEAALDLLEECDVLVLVPGWENSSGVLREVELAKDLGIPVINASELDTY
jgi:hypothetical protein